MRRDSNNTSKRKPWYAFFIPNCLQNQKDPQPVNKHKKRQHKSILESPRLNSQDSTSSYSHSSEDSRDGKDDEYQKNVLPFSESRASTTTTSTPKTPIPGSDTPRHDFSSEKDKNKLSQFALIDGQDLKLKYVKQGITAELSDSSDSEEKKNRNHL